MSTMPSCPNCGRWSFANKPCQHVKCLGCGTLQCFGNGSARGSCGACHYGILPGWSGWSCKCSYKGCGNDAAFRFVPRMGNVCLEHASRTKIRFNKTSQTLTAYVAHCVTHVPGWARGIIQLPLAGA